jgi:hypothetical protein
MITFTFMKARKTRLALVGFPIAGLISGLLTLRIDHHAVGNPSFLDGGIFGLLIGACLGAFLHLRSIWKIGVFILVSILAYYVSYFSAGLSHLYLFYRLRTEPAFLPEAFVGGFLGAFFIVMTALILLCPTQKWKQSFIKSILWAFFGGILGVLGSAAAPLLGVVRPHWALVPVYRSDPDVSLILVWQVGVAFLLALIFWIENNRLGPSLADQSK